MKLPNAELVQVQREKIVGYLLNPGHRYGSSKARFFARFGFNRDDWEALALALQDHGRTHEVCKMTATAFGSQYEVKGKLRTPDGRNPDVRSVWQLDRGMVAPRLITAYPLRTRS